jgi:nicotinamide mononucleotide adenylyltransferase
MNEQVQRALDEIEADTYLSAQQKLEAKAKVMRNARAIRGTPIGFANQTSVVRVFAQSMARAAGRGLIRGIFSLFKSR